MLLVCARCDGGVADKIARRAQASAVPVKSVNCLGVCDEGPACCVVVDEADAASELPERAGSAVIWVGHLHKKKQRRALYDWLESGSEARLSEVSRIEASRKARKRLRVLQSRET